MKIKVAIAEDNPNLARSIKENMSSFKDIEILFVASNGKDLLKKISSAIPDIILMDINMPGMNGIETTGIIQHHFPKVKIIMLTVFDDEEKIFQSILAGAKGYLLKDDKPEKIIAALEEVMEGGAPMSPAIARKALQMIIGKNISETKNDFNLTPREKEILEMISKGNNYHIIADKLFVSPRTVRKHIENIYTKLQVHNKVDAVRLALYNNIIN